MINSSFASLSFDQQVRSLGSDLFAEFQIEGGFGRSIESFYTDAFEILKKRQDRVINPLEADEAREDYLASFE